MTYNLLVRSWNLFNGIWSVFLMSLKKISEGIILFRAKDLFLTFVLQLYKIIFICLCALSLNIKCFSHYSSLSKKKKNLKNWKHCTLIFYPRVYLYLYACMHSIYHLSDFFNNHFVSTFCFSGTVPLAATIRKLLTPSHFLPLLLSLRENLAPWVSKS